MKKVVYLIDTLEIGGAEKSLLLISSELKDWTPIIISIYKGDNLKPKFESIGIKVYSLGLDNIFSFFRGYYRLLEILTLEKPDVLHATLYRSEQFSRFLGAKLKIPVINSFVNDSYTKDRYKFLSFRQKSVLNIYKAFDRLTAKKVSKFMSISNAIIPSNAKALGINHSDITVIPRGRMLKNNPVVLNKKIHNLKNELQGSGIVILTVGRLLKRKGYLDALRAVKIIVDKKYKVKYLIAGEGHDRLEIENFISKLELNNTVTLLGNSDDVEGLMTISDIFLFPSHYEGLGGSLIEAMLHEKAIVATRIPVIEESVIDNYSAKLFEIYNPNDLANNLIWAIENKNQMMEFGKNAKNAAYIKFDIKSIAKQHEILYNSLI